LDDIHLYILLPSRLGTGAIVARAQRSVEFLQAKRTSRLAARRWKIAVVIEHHMLD
jgi:hypothetical protein